MGGALVYALGGESAKARAFAERALRLSPFDPMAWHARLCLGYAALLEDHLDEAISHYAAAVHLNPQFGSLHAVHAMALALAGRMEEAGSVVRKTLEVDPSFRIGPILQMVHDPAFAEKLRRGMRLAGLPE